MSRLLLDTNTVSQLLRGHPGVARRIRQVPMADLGISCITEAELRFGLARRPDAQRLHEAVNAFLDRVEILPWNGACAICYGPLRAGLAARGITIAPLDLLIAAHAMACERTLVSNDKAFGRIDGLQLDDWTL